MITCQHIRQLFDRYLDDELSPSLQAELHAHILNCTPCRNHLALLEACGDVIRLDRREPHPGASFADGVLAARREQVAAAPRAAASGRWRRAGWYIGGPLAAAASIALILTVGAPVFDGRPSRETVVDGHSVAVPVQVRENLRNLAGTRLNPQAEIELKNTPEMKALPFLEALVNPLVEGTRNAVAGTRQSYEDIELLIRYGFAGMNDRLVAEYRERYPDMPTQTAERVIRDLNILDSALSPIGTAQPIRSDLTPASPVPSKPAASPDAF
ncbi:MAG TPA: zf-HC2 domain-containing protein [Phycisphaerae bacterium]|nr:zf-HC2 domain-containing protein [Phycisphaerae bacterium]